jgi:hypothetical protein
MAQTGYTPILIYSSSTTTNAPAAGNLTNSTLGSELAINITDGKLFYKDNANAIQVIGWKTTPTTAGGTGLTSYTAGDLLYYATGTTLAKLAIGASTTVLTSSGSAPQWTAQSSLSVGTASNLKSNATTGVMQIVGPAAAATRVMTIPDANFTAARTDASQNFTGTQGFSVIAATIANFTNNSQQILYEGTNGGYSLATGYTTSFYSYANAGVTGNVSYIANGGSYLQIANGLVAIVGTTFTITGNTYTVTSATPEGYVYVTPSAGGEAATGTLTGLTYATERLRINAGGNLLVNTLTGSNHYIAKAVAEGADILGVISTTTNLQTAYFMGVSSAGENAAASAIGVRKNSSTSRSINAAGTINASGADYAEYMTKAGNFTVAKGDVVGVDAQGKLTNVFADAVSFVVKSTDPSYVGGDVWGNESALGLTKPQVPSQREATEEINAETDEEFAIRNAQYELDKQAFEIALETARQRVDRIAFAGQVPVNVTNAIAGQYIIPVNDNGAIKGEAVSNPTFEQYQIAVGKVISIEPDGRAKIIVKVA